MTPAIVPAAGTRRTASFARHPRAAICTLATGTHRRFLDVTVPTLDAYARHHGWASVISSEHLAPERPASWSKLRLVQELLGEFEFVFWVDADAIVVDIERDILDEVEPDADLWYASHPQERDPDATVLNAGVFLARSSSFTTEFIDLIWSAEQYIEHNWWENAALLDLLGYSLEPPYPQTVVSPRQERIGELSLDWNSVPGYCESENPAINHHARSDHDDFDRRVAELEHDLHQTRRRFPTMFAEWNASLRVPRRSDSRAARKSSTRPGASAPTRRPG